jgi:hypothetical protein
MTEQSTIVATAPTEGVVVPTNYSLKVDGFLAADPDPGYVYGSTITGTFEGFVTGRGVSRDYKGDTDLDYTIEVKTFDAADAAGEPPLVTADKVTLSFDGRFELAGDPGFLHGRPVSGRFVARVDGDRTSSDYSGVRRVYRIMVTEIEVEGVVRKPVAPVSTGLPGVVATLLGRPTPAATEPEPTGRVRRAWKSFRRGPFGWVPMWLGFIAAWVGITLTLRAVVAILG